MSKKKIKIKDIALQASVSTATVDRVLNKRPGVRAATVELVEQAIGSLQNSQNTAPAVQVRGGSFGIVHPESSSASDLLIKHTLDYAERFGSRIEHLFFQAGQLNSLVRAIDELVEKKLDGLAIHTLDHPLIDNAINKAFNAGVPVMTYFSTIANPHLFAHVGINNRQAGRTAGYLLGSLLSEAGGEVMVITAGFPYRNHEERETGFRSSIQENFSNLDFYVENVLGRDDFEDMYQKTYSFIKKHPNLKGIYSVGSGHGGLIQAIKDHNLQGQIKVIAHNLTPATRQGLLDQSIHIVLHQDYSKIAEIIFSCLTQRNHNNLDKNNIQPFHIITKENIVG